MKEGLEKQVFLRIFKYMKKMIKNINWKKVFDFILNVIVLGTWFVSIFILAILLIMGFTKNN